MASSRTSHSESRPLLNSCADYLRAVKMHFCMEFYRKVTRAQRGRKEDQFCRWECKYASVQELNLGISYAVHMLMS